MSYASVRTNWRTSSPPQPRSRKTKPRADRAPQEIAFGPRQIRSLHPAEIEAAVADALSRTGLNADAERHPLDLTHAGQRWVTIASALANAPQLLLLDEPQRGLDQSNAMRLEALLREERARGAAILMICHDMDFVARNASAVLDLGDAGSRDARRSNRTQALALNIDFGSAVDVRCRRQSGCLNWQFGPTHLPIEISSSLSIDRRAANGIAAIALPGRAKVAILADQRVAVRRFVPILLEGKLHHAISESVGVVLEAKTGAARFEILQRVLGRGGACRKREASGERDGCDKRESPHHPSSAPGPEIPEPPTLPLSRSQPAARKSVSGRSLPSKR